MSGLVKWWESPFAWKLFGTTLLIMAISFVFAYFIDWGWIVAVAVALGGGYLLRTMVFNKLDEYYKEMEKRLSSPNDED